MVFKVEFRVEVAEPWSERYVVVVSSAVVVNGSQTQTYGQGRGRVDRKKAREQSSRSQPVWCGMAGGGRAIVTVAMVTTLGSRLVLRHSDVRARPAGCRCRYNNPCPTYAPPRRDCITPDAAAAATLLSLSETCRCGKTEIIFSRKNTKKIYERQVFPFICTYGYASPDKFFRADVLCIGLYVL